MDARPKIGIERLVPLAQAGALRAAAAFTQLANEPVVADAPVVAARAGATSDRAGDHADPGSTGIHFEFEGCIDALVGILFPASAGERLVRSIVGLESGDLDPTIVESALMEVGNILASHVASGIADALKARLLPSIPALAQGRAEAEFDAWVERVVGPDAIRIEARLANGSGDTLGRLIIVPTR
jgi:chemotaxis protein CheY-P-specific phosphatase CheC